MELLIECAKIISYSNDSRLNSLSEEYIETYYRENNKNPNYTLNKFYCELFDIVHLLEAYDEQEDDDPFNDDKNKSVKDYDKTTVIGSIDKKERRKSWDLKKKITAPRQWLHYQY